MVTYRFVRRATPEDWSPLPREFSEGDEIKEYAGHDYGCSRDDYNYGRVATIACSLTGDAPFFTVPVDWIVDAATGQHPVCEYAL